MVLFHGTNKSELEGGLLASGSWVTSDVYTAAAFAESRRGGSYIYVFWFEENELEYHTFPDDVMPAWKMKDSKRPIARLIYVNQTIIP